MYLSRKLTTRSLPEIGRRFGGRDHTTVLHACRRVEELCAEDAAFRQEVDFLQQMLSRLSVFAHQAGPALQSIDLNPVLAMPAGQGAYAVDAVIEIAL